MGNDSDNGDKGGAPAMFAEMLDAQSETARKLFGQFMPGPGGAMPDPVDIAQWQGVASRLQQMWMTFQADQVAKAANPPAVFSDPAQWLAVAQDWYSKMPLANPDVQQKLWADGLALWQGVLGQFGIGDSAGEAKSAPELPRKDRRFKDERWASQPAFALIHQTYLMLSEQLTAMADNVQGLDDAKKEQLRFATRTLLEALSPANFPLTNPIVLERTLESKGENLVKGMEHMLADMSRGQLTHTDPHAFRLGENIAVTPGKVVLETPMFQLIQYSPTTENVLETPLVIFPPWINRFYILDLNPQKSFIRWAVEQGVTVFIVSWKSADESMKDVLWDDYVLGQIEAIDFVRDRLGVKSVHTIGYCVAGTTLAATLALLARRNQADKVKSATFFTAQVDFTDAGELKLFIDEKQMNAMRKLSGKGFLDGRYMAATFNLLRGQDLIWNYVVNNYLMGEDYPAFDLLHWNGDTTNLPATWHRSYLEDLYRDNRLVVPDSLSIDGTPLDLTRIKTPTYIQAGREDHIAPAASVWKLTRHLRGPYRFLLAGSGHIAGVVNPPSMKKYQYWTNEKPAETLADFIAGAVEHPGSWWPNWIEWLREQDGAEVPAKGKRVPGSKGDKVVEDAPGSYVKTR